MDALDILARIDGGQPVTHEELGYLLPELERRGHIKVEMTQRCCEKIFARIYRYRGRPFLWVGGQLGYNQTGIVKVPPRAVVLTDMPPGFQLHGYISTHNLQEMRPRLAFLPRQSHRNRGGSWGAADLHTNR